MNKAPGLFSRPPGKLSDQERLLLHAALLEGPSAVQAWEAWLATLDFEKDPIPGGSYRLLPLVYRNLKDAQPEPSQLRRLKGIHNQAWYRSRLGMAPVQAAFRQLQENKLQFCLLEGSSQAAGSLCGLDLAPGGEFSLYLSWADFQKACTLLQASGWQAHALSFPLHAGNMRFTRAGAAGLFLTWKPFPLASGAAAAQRMQASAPCSLAGLDLLAAPALDCLLFAAAQAKYDARSLRTDRLAKIGLLLKNHRFDPLKLKEISDSLRIGGALAAALDALDIPAGSWCADPAALPKSSLPESLLGWLIEHLQPRVRRARAFRRRPLPPEYPGP